MSLFNFIKQHISILEVVKEYASLKKAGLYYKGVCPFHHEKTASFTVSPHKEIFYCFGCHSGGDAISFIAQAENCGPLQAAQFLIERYNLDIPESLRSSKKGDPDHHSSAKKQYHILANAVLEWCHENLIKSPAVLRYLTNRNINQETIKAFKLGYFPGSATSVKNLIYAVKDKGYLIDDLLQAHIIAQGKSVLYSPFENRIIFPINDHLGRTCGFGGRVFKKDDERPKYYNSKENAFFSKGSLLFGLDKAKNSIQYENSVFLVEGYTDCLSMVQHGFVNTVATLGTACTIDHLRILSRYAHELFILYDGDKAGKNAVLRLTELCWQVDLELKVLKLPAGEDPDSFLSKKGDLENLIAQAQDIFTFSIESSAQNFTELSLQEKIAIVRNLLATVAAIGDPLKQEFLLAQASKVFEIPLSSLKRELKGITTTNLLKAKTGYQRLQTEQTVDQNPAINVLKEIPILEKKLFSVIINNVPLLDHGDIEYLLDYLSLPLQNLLKKIVKIKGDPNPLDFTQFFDTLQENEKLLVSHLVLEGHEYEGSENLEYLLAEFQKKTWKSYVTDTKLKLEQARKEHNDQGIKKILEHFQQLKKKLVHKGLI